MFPTALFTHHARVEMALLHTVENKVEDAYRRGDLFERQRQLMASWARFCTNSPLSDIVPMQWRA
jgi:hypothetical protein